MKLLDLKAGTNPRRVRIFLAEKGLSIPLIEVDLLGGENRQQEYLRKNPVGTMPVLEFDDGSYLSELMAICRYIEEEVAPLPNLFGEGARERADIEMWNWRMEFEFLLPILASFEHLSPYWKDRRVQVAAVGEAGRTKATEGMAWLDAELGSRAYIAGDRYTVADITAQSAFVLGKNTGTPIDPKFSNLVRWYRDVTSRPTARA